MLITFSHFWQPFLRKSWATQSTQQRRIINSRLGESQKSYPACRQESGPEAKHSIGESSDKSGGRETKGIAKHFRVQGCSSAEKSVIYLKGRRNVSCPCQPKQFCAAQRLSPCFATLIPMTSMPLKSIQW